MTAQPAPLWPGGTPDAAPAPLRDGQRAIQLARHHAAPWCLDPAQVGMLDFSAGGHLAASVVTQPDAVAPASADPVARRSRRPALLALAYPVISLVDHAHIGSIEHSLLFASALSRHGVPFGLHVYPHGRHGLGTWTALCAAWLADRGYGHGATSGI